MPTLLSWPLEVLFTVMVTRALPPGVTEVGLKTLLLVMPVVTLKVAEAALGMVPPEVDRSEGLMVLSLAPKVMLVTLTVIVQVLSGEASGRAASDPALKVSLLSFG